MRRNHWGAGIVSVLLGAACSSGGEGNPPQTGAAATSTGAGGQGTGGATGGMSGGPSTAGTGDGVGGSSSTSAGSSSTTSGTGGGAGASGSSNTGNDAGPSDGSTVDAATDIGSSVDARIEASTGPRDAANAGDATDAGRYPLQYQQTFASPTSLADMVFSNPTHWSHDATAGGWLALLQPGGYAPPFPSPTSVAIVAVGRFGSLELEVEVQQTGIDYGHRDHCLFFGVEDPSHFYYAHVATAPDGVSHQIHIVNNAARRAITTSRSMGYDWGRDVWRRLRLVRDVESGLIEVYGEGSTAPILTANDKTFGLGYVGFGSFDDVGRVRNAKVWSAQFVAGRPAFFTAK